MKTLFKQLYFWPSKNNEIEQLVPVCEACCSHRPSQPAELLQPIAAKYPMERISVDLFDSGGIKYLSIIDRFSGFPFAAKLSSTTTSAITKELLKIFTQFGFAEVIRSDNGPQFRQEFDSFCKKHGIVHETSSPYFPQSNGHAESGVKICKQLLQKQDHHWDNFLLALLEWRNTPKPDGISPAQMMFGRRQRTALPTLPPMNIDPAAASGSRARQDARMKETFDKNTHCIPELMVGDEVVIQDHATRKWTRQGRIKECFPHGSSYIIEFPNEGQEMRRNRIFIRKV